MNIKTAIGLNCPIDMMQKDHYVYLSVDDVAFAETIRDRDDNVFSIIHMKSGQSIKVLGCSYHILGIKDAKNKE